MKADQTAVGPSVTDTVARNVREARAERGWTLDQLAGRSGVSKGMVVQIEQGKTNPSIGTLSKVSEALGVSLPDLVGGGEIPLVRVVSGEEAALLWETPGGSSARLLVGGRRPDFIEIWEWVLVPGDAYRGRVHGAGIRELLHVDTGELTLIVDDDMRTVATGSSAAYPGDVPHEYRNDGSETVRLILVMVDPSGSRAVARED